MPHTVEKTVSGKGDGGKWCVYHIDIGLRGLVGREVDGGQFTVDHLHVEVEVVEDAVAESRHGVVSDATARDEVGIEIVHRHGLRACPVLHVVRHVVDGVRCATVVEVGFRQEMDAVHLAVGIDGTAQWGSHHVVALAQLGERWLFLHFQLVDTGCCVLHGP